MGAICHKYTGIINLHYMRKTSVQVSINNENHTEFILFKQKSGHNLRKKANYQQVITSNQPVTVNFIYILDEGKYFSNS